MARANAPLRVLLLAFALAAGVATVFGFAPFGVAPLPVLSLAVLFALWRDAFRRTGGNHGADTIIKTRMTPPKQDWLISQQVQHKVVRSDVV